MDYLKVLEQLILQLINFKLRKSQIIVLVDKRIKQPFPDKSAKITV